VTLNILFLTIIIKKRALNLDEAMQQEMVEKLYEDHKDRSITMYRIM
jgi:uncharacterized protein (TIGR02413 family)